MNKRRLISLIISLMVLGGFAYYLYDLSETEREIPPNDIGNDNGSNEWIGIDPTIDLDIPEDWVEFQDDVAGYSIQRPSDWNTSKMANYRQESTIESFEQGTIPFGPVPDEELKVAVRRFTSRESIEYAPPEQETILEERQIIVANRSATWRRVENLGISISVELEENNDTYIIAAFPANSIYIENFVRMLNTFQFIPSVDVENPLPGTTVTSPINISGRAPGTWFFEASLSAELVGSNGTLIAETPLQTAEEWMTEEQVPFEGTIELEQAPEEENLTLIIRAANPSGLPEFERSLEIPVRYETN